MSSVFSIDPKHVEGEKRLGRAIARILDDKVVRTDGCYIVTPTHMHQLQRAFEKTFAKPPLTSTGKQIMASFRRNRRKPRN